MQKPIIATTLAGLYVKTEPWKNAHILWFEDAAKKLNDMSVLKWASKPSNYFMGVDEVMKRLYPELSEEEKTKKARESFFGSVCKQIEQNPLLKNQEVIDFFKGIKNKYSIALITTNTEQTTKKILRILGLDSFFDFIEASSPDEKDDKTKVIGRFIEKHGNPFIYAGGDRKEAYDYLRQKGIRCIFINLEGSSKIDGVKTVFSLNEFAKSLEKG